VTSRHAGSSSLGVSDRLVLEAPGDRVLWQRLLGVWVSAVEPRRLTLTQENTELRRTLQVLF
jgi:hypothetical protein